MLEIKLLISFWNKLRPTNEKIIVIRVIWQEIYLFENLEFIFQNDKSSANVVHLAIDCMCFFSTFFVPYHLVLVDVNDGPVIAKNANLPILFELSLISVQTFNGGAGLHACVHRPCGNTQFFPSKMFRAINKLSLLFVGLQRIDSDVMNWLRSHFFSSFSVYRFYISHCTLSNVFDSKSWDYLSVVCSHLIDIRRSLVGILCFFPFKSKEFFEVFWWLLCSPKLWVDDFREIHSVFICEELPVVYDVVEVMMHLLQSRTFCGFEKLKTSDWVKRSVIPWYTNNWSQISFHLNNS